MKADKNNASTSFETHCRECLSTVRKKSGKKLSLKKPAWILMLGTDQSGKTSLLEHSPQSINCCDGEKSTDEKPINWCASKDAVFIDPPSNVALAENESGQSHWDKLLHFIETHRTGRRINQVILVIDQPQLMTLNKLKLEQLSTQLKSVQNITRALPISIVISQCDKIPGFTATFDNLNKEQRKQKLSFSFSKTQQTERLIPELRQSLTTIISRIRERLIFRLHREQNLEKRHRILQLPNEFSKLYEPLKELVSGLGLNEHLFLQDIYFTGIHRHREFFINKAIQSCIKKAKEPLPNLSKHPKERLLAFPIAAAVIFGCTIAWHLSYNQIIHVINETQNALASSIDDSASSLPWLTQLNRLEKLNQIFHKDELLPFHWAGLIQAHEIEKYTKKQYQAVLNKKFKSYLENTLQKQIELGLTGDKLALFDALKAYLAATNKRYFNKESIEGWYRIYWKTIYAQKPLLQEKLLNYLDTLLDPEEPLWPANEKLVTQARESLKKLPLSDLAFLELQGEYTNTNVPIFPNGKLEGISLKEATVPEFFSMDNFKDIFKTKIPQINKLLAKGNWVLGTRTGETINDAQKAAIIKTIRKMYLNFYRGVWSSAMTNIQIEPASNYKAVLKRIDMLTDNKSELLKLLNLTIGNATLDGATPSKDITALQDYLNKKGNYASVIRALNNLKAMIQSIKASKTPRKMSFTIAMARFKSNGIGDPISQLFTIAKNSPEPLQSWLNTIASSTWKTMLKQTRAYLNKVWQSIVVPIYHKEIKNRYPVFKDSSNNITLKHFNEFFGPNGVVGTFFIYYLQNFINMTSNYWTWRSLNEMNLGISQKVLNTFIRASIIQQMFFSNNKNEASFKFILASINLSNNSKDMTLNVGGQTYSIYHQKQNSAKPFNWPGPKANFASLQFTSSQGESKQESYTGPWAWFRLLDANTLHNTGDPEQFTLSLHIDNYAANFKLVAEHRVNPMVPGVIAKYRCPEHL